MIRPAQLPEPMSQMGTGGRNVLLCSCLVGVAKDSMELGWIMVTMDKLQSKLTTFYCTVVHFYLWMGGIYCLVIKRDDCAKSQICTSDIRNHSFAYMYTAAAAAPRRVAEVIPVLHCRASILRAVLLDCSTGAALVESLVAFLPADERFAGVFD